LTFLVTQVAHIAWRSVVRTMRQPGEVIPPLTFPLMLMAVNSNGLQAATGLPGFPTDSFLAFFLPFSFMQGAVFASLTAGTHLARDIDNGFLNRLALTPMHGTALLLGQVGGAVTLGALQALVYLVVGLAFGVRFETGAAGIATLFVLAVLIAFAWAAVGLVIALRAGTGEKVQSQFPLLFFLLFISSMNLPRDLIEQEWFRGLATLNPVSYMIEGLRALIITGWDAQALALAFGLSAAVMAVALGGAAVALRTRMERT
jgi:ABC-2 type transport system permease protein